MCNIFLEGRTVFNALAPLSSPTPSYNIKPTLTFTSYISIILLPLLFKRVQTVWSIEYEKISHSALKKLPSTLVYNHSIIVKCKLQIFFNWIGNYKCGYLAVFEVFEVRGAENFSNSVDYTIWTWRFHLIKPNLWGYFIWLNLWSLFYKLNKYFT